MSDGHGLPSLRKKSFNARVDVPSDGIVHGSFRSSAANTWPTTERANHKGFVSMSMLLPIQSFRFFCLVRTNPIFFKPTAEKAQPEADNLRLSALEQQAPLQPPEQEDAYTVDVQPEPLAYEPSQGAVFYPETEPDIPASLQPMLTSPPESMALPSGLATDKPQYAEVIETKRVAYFWRNYKLEIQGSELPAVFWELGTNSKLPYGLSLNNKEGTLFGFIWGKTRAEIPFIVTLSDESRHEVTGILEVK